MAETADVVAEGTESETVVDPSWGRFYRIGGVTALLYVVLSIVVPGTLVLATDYDFDMNGAALLEYLGENELLWVTVQTLTLGASILAIITFVAIFLALKDVEKNLAALGTVIAITCHLLFLAYYPVLLGLAHLGDLYVGASPTEQATYATAAEALLAQNNAFNPLYESVFAIGVLLLSVVMLQGVFGRWIGYLGIATTVAAIAGLALWPVFGVAYIWWWFVFMCWFIAVGWRLYRLGSRESVDAAAAESVLSK